MKHPSDTVGLTSGFLLGATPRETAQELVSVWPSQDEHDHTQRPEVVWAFGNYCIKVAEEMERHAGDVTAS